MGILGNFYCCWDEVTHQRLFAVYRLYFVAVQTDVLVVVSRWVSFGVPLPPDHELTINIPASARLPLVSLEGKSLSALES